MTPREGDAGETVPCGEIRPGVYTSYGQAPSIPTCDLPAGHGGDHCEHDRILKGDTYWWERGPESSYPASAEDR